MQDAILVHHGVKGMKWGVRRYRNKDGSLTVEGKLHAQKKADRQAEKSKKQEYKHASKNRRSLSTEELSRRIQRLEKEKKLKDLTNDNVRSEGGKFARDVLKTSGKRVLTGAVAGGAVLIGRVILQQAGISVEDARVMFPNPNKKK